MFLDIGAFLASCGEAIDGQIDPEPAGRMRCRRVVVETIDQNPSVIPV
jgi:hypothetical protein